jgi:dienelactone hydrolase
MMRARRLVVIVALSALLFARAGVTGQPSEVVLPIRGVNQTLYVFGADNRRPDPPAVVLFSGDGGWHGFIIEIAQHLAEQGYTTVGVDSKAYLTSFSRPKVLEPAQVGRDMAMLANFAKAQAQAKSIVLAGWSEGAGLALLGALDPALRTEVRGVVAIGLPEVNELAWRWRDSVIYLTHKVPNEPTFNSKDYVGKLAPVPLMVIQSTHDDFVPPATARSIFACAQEPKQITFIDARNHRFEGQRPAFWQALDRSLAWFDSLAENHPR